MSDRPFFSIIIPSFKIEPFLEQCLESVLNQTFTSFECLVLNDDSPGLALEHWSNGQDPNFAHQFLPSEIALPDQLEWIFDKVIKNDKRFRLIKKPNEGLAGTKNRGIDESTGKHLVILDGDDYLKSNYLEVANQAIVNNPNKIIFGTLKTVRNGQMNSFESISKFLPKINKLSTILLFPTWTATPINYFWNLDLIKTRDLRCVTTGRGEDTCFALDSILAYHKEYNTDVEDFVKLDEAVYYYRQFDKQMSKEKGFELALFQNLANNVTSKLTTLKQISLKHYILGRLFVWRMQLYTFRLKNDNNYQGKLAGIIAKILSGVALIVTKV